MKRNCAYAESAEEIESLSKLGSRKITQIKTQFYEQVALSASKERFPVVMYSHGSGSYLM